HRLRLEALPQRLEQREVLDALRAPVGRQLGDRHAPDLLRVRLEEVLVETPSEATRVEALEVLLVLRRLDPDPQVRPAAAHRLDEPERLQCLQGHDRVVEQLPPVEDAAHPGTAQELVLAEDLEPEVVDRLDLREEAVSADVEAPPVALDRPADAADDVVR